ncbi:MAG: pilus assembly protein PilM, partial [Candidatus Magasanikbacteria bacterium]|nr:pilus assembly protein PilM [Candidatus Magasanikbacteria bacterium]
MILGKKSKFPIGLDISDLSLKLIQLKQKHGKIKIQALGRQVLPKGVIENGEIINEEELLKAINKIITKPKYGTVSSDEVIACLPETKTFIKTIRIDDNPNKISDIVEHEIEKHIPFSIDEMYYDWQTIKKSENYSLVLVGAAPKKIVDQYTQLLNNAKLSIRALEIEPISICRCVLPEESTKFDRKISKNYAILDIGAKRTSIIIYANNTVITSISLPISGEETTEKIAKTLEISHDQAEKAKVICGLDKEKAQGVISEILCEKIDNLV